MELTSTQKGRFRPKYPKYEPGKCTHYLPWKKGSLAITTPEWLHSELLLDVVVTRVSAWNPWWRLAKLYQRDTTRLS